ncbi:MAG: hypothetical protein Q8R28_11470 [Dehalococcoidia bacterium]|nr:hypothetical protein [Dehalococcoidia bacterium]
MRLKKGRVIAGVVLAVLACGLLSATAVAALLGQWHIAVALLGASGGLTFGAMHFFLKRFP